VRAHNRAAWDLLARSGDRWTIPVEPAAIAAARKGRWSVQLTNSATVPRAWFPETLAGVGVVPQNDADKAWPAGHAGVDVLALAGGGGQQGPILAAAGARVTVLDNSAEQLGKDRLVAKREGLDITIVEGTMEDLSVFADASFDLVLNPASAMFTRDVRRVWREAARVLRPGGALLAGFVKPEVYLFDRAALDGAAPLDVKHRLPYSDETQLPKPEFDARVGRREPLEFSHTLADLLGGQMDAGLQLVAMYEDVFGDAALDKHMPTMMATRAVKPLAASARR